LILILIAASFALAMTSPAGAGVVVLGPISDAAGTDQPRDGVFDSFFPSNTVYLVGGGGNAEYRSVAEFSLLGIPAGSTISSAKLHLTAVSAAGSGGVVGVMSRLYAGNGVAEITDLTASGATLGPVNVSLGQFPQIDFTYTSEIQSLFSAGAQYAGITLLSNPSDYVLEFGARSHPNASSHPTLTVTYTVPEPSTWILMSIGLFGAVSVYRSRS
jgi:hypothetical protein